MRIVRIAAVVLLFATSLFFWNSRRGLPTTNLGTQSPKGLNSKDNSKDNFKDNSKDAAPPQRNLRRLTIEKRPTAAPQESRQGSDSPTKTPTKLGNTKKSDSQSDDESIRQPKKMPVIPRQSAQLAAKPAKNPPIRVAVSEPVPTNNSSSGNSTQPPQTQANQPDQTPSASEFGRISLRSSPASEIFINNKKLGITSDATSSSNWIKLTPGTYSLELRRRGFVSHFRKIEITGGRDLQLTEIQLARAELHPLVIVSDGFPAIATIREINTGARFQIPIKSASVSTELQAGRYEVTIEYKNNNQRREVVIPGPVSNLIFSVKFGDGAWP